MENNEEYLAFAKEMAYEAGEIMKKYYKEDNGASYKYDQTIVTKADTEINSLLIQKVKKKNSIFAKKNIKKISKTLDIF